jgi:hypothetical protein
MAGGEHLMSVCISRHGEFSSHELDAAHTCTLCGVLDEDALRAELERLGAAYIQVIEDAERFRSLARAAERERDEARAELAVVIGERDDALHMVDELAFGKREE